MTKNEHPLWSVGFVLIFLSLQILSEAATLVVVSLVGGKSVGGLDAAGTIIALIVFNLASIALFTLARWSPVSARYAASRPWSVLLWSAVASLGALLPSLFIQELLPEWPDAIQEYIEKAESTAAMLMNTRGGYAVVCLLAPVAEELVFRGAALRILLQWKPQRRWPMIALSAVMFAIAHLNPSQLLHPFLIGLLLGWMYERTGSILPGIVYHWANNTAAYLLYHAYPSLDITLADIFGSEQRALMAVFFSMLIIVPAIFQLNERMRRCS